jgi:hypothetical protein
MKKLFKFVAIFAFSNIAYSQTTSPAPLTIQTSPTVNVVVTTDATFGRLNTTQSRFLFNKDVNTSTGGFSSNGVDLTLKTSNTTRMTISNSTGNFGFGVAPLAADRLNVNGNIRLQAGNIYIPYSNKAQFGNVNPQSAMFVISTGTYNNYLDFVGNTYFRNIAIDGTTNLGACLGLQKDGTVTIGVWENYTNIVANTDGHKLMVNGGILCEKVKVIVDVPNSDHVFAPEYKLMPLKDVKLFVEENKHLPEVPSAACFKEEGYNIGEMDDLLLRKVEELTLYILMLEEQNKKLEERILKLEE